jgi:hypothetical protein
VARSQTDPFPKTDEEVGHVTAVPAELLERLRKRPSVEKHATHNQEDHGRWASLGRVPGGRVGALSEGARIKLGRWADKNHVDEDGMVSSVMEALRDPAARAAGGGWYREEFNAKVLALAEETGYPADVVGAVVAITSAQNRWSASDLSAPLGALQYPNLDTASRFLRMARDGAFDDVASEEEAKRVSTGYMMASGFGWNVIQLLNGSMDIDAAVTGAKRRSFYDNGMFPETSTAVTNDTWMGEYLVRHSDLSYSNVQSALSGKVPAYLANEGVHASPAYLVLSEAIRRAGEQAKGEGLIPEDWLPWQVQATAWMHLGGGSGRAVGGRGAK